jgi:16S rRNA (uracil1498-N3)-methyltransferase
MPRIYLPGVVPVCNQIKITGEKAHYLTTVLRCNKGDELGVFDAEGNCFRTVIMKADKKEVTAVVLEKFLCDLESPLHIVLLQGLLKGEKMDLVIQKATELGVKEIIPVITDRSQIRETKKIVRWRKVAEEASKQSGRSVIPLIHEAVEFKKIFSPQTYADYPPLAVLPKRGGFIFYEEQGMKLSEAIKIINQSDKSSIPLSKKGGEGRVMVTIGPEGGFTGEEVSLAEKKGFYVVSLGKRILRAETAAISAVTLVQFLLGDMS